MGLSFSEILLVFLAVLLLFGSKMIPDIARMLGKGMHEFRKASDEIKREFHESTREIKEDINDSRRILEEESRSFEEKVREEMLNDDNETYDHEPGQPEINSTKKPNRSGIEKTIPTDEEPKEDTNSPNKTEE